MRSDSSLFLGAALNVSDRLVRSDAQWARMALLITGRPDQRSSTGHDNRMFVEGVRWIVRTGSSRRDRPDAPGEWHSAFLRRFSRRSRKGDAPRAEALLKGLPADVILADATDDSGRLCTLVAGKGARAVIPNTMSRAKKYDHDKAH